MHMHTVTECKKMVKLWWGGVAGKRGVGGLKVKISTGAMLSKVAK